MIKQSSSSISDRIWAALMFFTRLPFWKIRKNVPQEAFRHVVEYWTLSGWLTGGTLAVSYWLCAQIFPTAIALLIALAARLLLTGAFHEDGLADFMDGFGGGHSRERILAIMKDSHIGTFGVLGLVLYLALLYTTWLHLPSHNLPFYLFAGDLYAKACSSQIICRFRRRKNQNNLYPPSWPEHSALLATPSGTTFPDISMGSPLSGPTTCHMDLAGTSALCRSSDPLSSQTDSRIYR